MSHVSDQLLAKIILEIDDIKSVHDKQDELELTSATIQFFLAEMIIITMYIIEPCIMSSERYARMNTPGEHSLPFCDSNGAVYITRQETEGNFKFEVSRFGCGGGGVITIHMPIHVCEPVFTALAEWRRKYE
jgi:hypothetical protein